MASARNFGWDSLKGILILLVIVGHVIPEPLESSLVRSIIYSFHMPLFIFLAGYLFPLERWLSVSPLEMMRQYKWRIIVPWIIAVFVFCALSIYVYQSQQNPLIVLIRHFLKPYFHLWFVPSLLLWMLLTRFLYHRVRSSAQRLWWVLGVSFVFYGISHWVDFESLPGYFAPLDGFQSIYRMQYWIFFVWGVFLKQHGQWLRPIPAMKWIYPAYFLAVVVQFYWQQWALGMMIFFIANLLLLFQVASGIAQYQGKGWAWLNFLGQESMGIYLWHYVCTMLIKFEIGTQNLFHYYWANVLGLILTFVLLYLFTKNKWTHQWLMGVKEKS